MKLFFTALALWLSTAAWSAIYTVSNNPTVPAQFSDVQSAHNFAEAGDTLQLVGSTVGYNYLSATKRIHIIGPGWGGPGLPAYLYAPTFGVGSDGSTIQGIYLNYNIALNAPNIIVKECYAYQINFNGAGANALIQNCVGLRSIYDLGSASGQVISNCLFNFSDGTGAYQPWCYIDGSNSAMAYPSLITNCTFYLVTMNELYNASFSNCVMHSVLETVTWMGGDYDNCVNCTINNSMLFCSGCAFADIDGGATLLDNLSNTINPFVNAPQTPNAYANNVLPFSSFNFSLVSSSPGINAGSDGTTIGIQGGAYPFAEGSMYGGMSGSVPYISSFIINNPVIPEGGTLNIQATAIIPANQ